MRGVLFILVIFLGPVCLPGQTAEDEVARLKQSMVTLQDSSGSGGGESYDGPSAVPGRWNVTVGTHFSYLGGFGSGTGFYVAPAYTLPLNARWALHGGILASGFALWNTPGAEYRTPATFSGLALFAAASYRMSDRLILHGSGVKQLATLPLSPMVTYPRDNLALGATYRLGDHVTLGATIRVMNGQQDYFGSPFHSSYLTSPFNSPLGW
jgi:hypothetical protein